MADDVTSLLELARAKAASRAELLAALADELGGAPRGLLTDAERSLMTGMLRGLVETVAGDLRARLARRLNGDGGERARLRDLPLDAVLAALRRSGILAEPALIDAAYHRLLEFQLEMQARDRARPVAPRAEGGSDVIAGLIARADASTRQALNGFLVAQAKRLDAYRNPLLSPMDVPEAGLVPLAWAVAVVFREALAAPAGAPPDALDDAIEAATIEAIEAALGGDDDGSRPAALADRLVTAGLAGPDQAAPLLRHGEVGLFQALMARLGGVDPLRLRRFLFEPGGEALAVCARAIGLARDDLAAILEATRSARQRPRAVNGGEVAAALALYDRITPEAAGRLARHWARRRDFLWMIRRLGTETRPGAQQSLRG